MQEEAAARRQRASMGPGWQRGEGAPNHLSAFSLGPQHAERPRTGGHIRVQLQPGVAKASALLLCWERGFLAEAELLLWSCCVSRQRLVLLMCMHAFMVAPTALLPARVRSRLYSHVLTVCVGWVHSVCMQTCAAMCWCTRGCRSWGCRPCSGPWSAGLSHRSRGIRCTMQSTSTGTHLLVTRCLQCSGLHHAVQRVMVLP